MATSLPLEYTPVTWEVFLQERDGRQVRPLTDVVKRGRVSVSLNGLGYFSLELDRAKLAELGFNDISDDMMLEFVRKHGAVRAWSFHKRRTVRTEKTLLIAGFGLNHLIKRRWVAYFAGSSYAQKTDYLDNMMKAIVRENMTSAAVHFETGAAETARDFGQVMTFTVADDLSQAPSDTMAFAWDNCYETLLKIAANSTQQGTRLFFEIARTGETAFEFRTYTDVQGTDRRGSKTFSSRHGNLSETEYSRDASAALTYLYIAGRGDASARKVAELATDEALDAFSRVEGVYNATSTPDVSLPAVGYQVLRKNRVLETFRGKLVNGENSYYGVDWDLGDLLDAKDEDEEFSIMVTGLDLEFGTAQVNGSFEVLADDA